MKVGDRVEIPPHMDLWMRGDRFGTVTHVGKRISVKLDKSEKVIRFLNEDSLKLID